MTREYIGGILGGAGVCLVIQAGFRYYSTASHIWDPALVLPAGALIACGAGLARSAQHCPTRMGESADAYSDER